MSTNIPEDLMDNVEKNLRKHIKDKKRKIHIYKATAAIISLFVILPGSALAVAKYNNSIVYSQEIDLARENKNITEVNETFKYRNVEFKIKEIVADATGMEVLYEASDPRYSIDEITFGDKDGEQFKEWGYSYPSPCPDNKEKSFLITLNNNAVSYMHDNPITIKIKTLDFDDNEKSKKPLNKFFDKITSLIYPEDDLKIDWTLKMQIPMQPVKTLPINKEYSLDIGTLKINSLQVGVLKSVFDYSFTPKDKNVNYIMPLFSVRLDNEFVAVHSSNNYGINSGETTADTASEFTDFDLKDNKGIYGTQEFSSIYYKDVNEIGIKLLGIDVNYDFGTSNVYKIDKNNLPNIFNFNGEEFKITAMEEKEDSTEYTFEFNKTNRVYSQILFSFPDIFDFRFDQTFDDIEFTDEASRDKIHSILAEKIPNFEDITNNYGFFNTGILSGKATTTSKSPEFIVDFASKSFIYDEEEITWHK